jgi:hypothetical protein
MTWYQLSKVSALPPDWYKNFAHHLENNAQLLIFNNPDFQLRNSVINNPYSSGIDGHKIFWSFKTVYKNQLFSANVRFEFLTDEQHKPLLTDAKWKDARLLSFDTNVELLKAEYFILWQDPEVKPKRRQLNDWFRIAHHFFLPNKLSPYQIISEIKNDIIKFTDDEDDDDQSEDAPAPQPPSLKLDTPKQKKQTKLPSLSSV